MSPDDVPVLSLPNVKGHPWTIVLRPDGLEFAATGVDSFTVRRQDLARAIDLPRLFNPDAPALILISVKHPGFRLEPDHAAALRSWTGALTYTDLEDTLRRRFRWAIPIAAFLVITSLPPLLTPVDPFGVILGVGLFSQALFARAYPHPRQFLFEAFWWSLPAGRNFYHFVLEYSMVSLAFAFVCVAFLVSAVRQFRLFQHASPYSAAPAA